MTIFGWGKWTSDDVSRAFGADEELSALIPLQMPPPPEIPALDARAVSCDVAEVVSRLVPVPPVDLLSELARLPPIEPRRWEPRISTDAALESHSTGSYASLPAVDLDEALSLAERVERETRRG